MSSNPNRGEYELSESDEHVIKYLHGYRWFSVFVSALGCLLLSFGIYLIFLRDLGECARLNYSFRLLSIGFIPMGYLMWPAYSLIDKLVKHYELSENDEHVIQYLNGYRWFSVFMSALGFLGLSFGIYLLLFMDLGECELPNNPLIKFSIAFISMGYLMWHAYSLIDKLVKCKNQKDEPILNDTFTRL